MPIVTTNIPMSGDVWPEVPESIAWTIMRAISLPKPLPAVKWGRSEVLDADAVGTRHMLVIVILDQPVVPEAAHLLDDRQKRAALVGELILDARR